jgi:hypothetical protein
MHKSDKYRKNGIETFRLEHCAPVLYSNGSTLHARMAARDTGVAPGGRHSLSDASRLLAPGQLSRDLGDGVTATRTPEGGIALSSGGLRRALADADIDARIKLRTPDKE